MGVSDGSSVWVGGRVAEELVFGDISTGAQDDLHKATNIARAMVKAYGMSELLGAVSLEREPAIPFLHGERRDASGDYSEQISREVDSEVRRIVWEQEERVRRILSSRLEALKLAASTLLEKETLGGEELREVVDRSQVWPKHAS
mgnify:CR=1 FL=1